MRIIKANPVLKIANDAVVDSSQPSNLNYAWNFGSLLALCLGIQIITGVLLAMHYNPSVSEAFDSVEHIMRDVNNGWLIRYIHSNTASAFFLIVYFHIGRGLYYGSYMPPRTLVWTIGTIIFIFMMATAFLGYLHSPKWFNIRNKEFIIYHKTNKFISIVKRSYCTNVYSNSFKVSERLETIVNELDLNYIYVYENLNLENTRKLILNNTKGLSGIYMIINKTTKDYYIGSASTNRFYARFCNHVIYLKGSKIVKLAIKKYDIKNFAFIILDLYPNIVTKENNKELLDLEDKYLKLLVPNYNILTEAGSSFGYKHTEIDRQKMKNIYNNRREKTGNLSKDKKFSSETIEKIKQKALARYPMPDEAKNKHIANTRPVLLYNLDRTIYGKYFTILEAANAINCSEKTIIRALQTKKKLVKRQWIVEDISNK